MGNKQIKDSDAPNAYYSLYNNNYLANCYKYLIHSKSIHFIASLIETLFNIIQELYIFHREYNLEKDKKNKILEFLIFIPEHIDTLSMVFKALIILLYIIVFDIIYYYLGKIKYKKENIYIIILYNIIELFFFRISMILFLNIYCCLSYIYFFLFLLLLFPHLYITFYHFLYNHLYVFVPIFIEYPYDEFSSLFDIFSLFIKILLSIISNSNIISVRKSLYLITFILQIFCCIYFIYYLNYHSYLFMKNLFLSMTKIAFFFIQTLVLILIELIGRNGISSISFLIIFVSLFVIILLYVYLVYDPIMYISIKRETPNENMYFFLFVLSNETQPCYLIENKINIHFESCGICKLCKKYILYLKQRTGYELIEESENINYIKKEINKRTDRLINIFFDILYDGKNKFFPLIKEMILTYKYNTQNLLDNVSYFYINLSFLLFSELKSSNYVLALNIKIILEVINNTNKLLDIHEAQIRQITLCDQFLYLVRSTLSQINNILKSEENQAIKFLNLSKSLNEMKENKYRELLFSHKHDDNSSSKNLIYVCSLLYEEIFNVILNSNQIPLRDNYQILEDNFINTDKLERIISLALNLTNRNCKIVRAGRDLYNYRDNNLFDLIPLIFKDYLQKVFISNIMYHFNSNIIENKGKKIEVINKINNNINTDSKHENKIMKRISMRRESSPKNIAKSEYIEFKMIISENISSKTFFKLLILKLTPLFNYNYDSCYILLDGSFKLYKNTIMTLQEIKNQTETKKKIISVSKPELEFPSELYIMPFQKYIISIEKKNYQLVEILDFSFSNKLISIYSIIPKDKEAYKKFSFYSNETIKFGFNSKLEKKTSKKIEYYAEDTTSVNSQPVSYNNPNFASGFNIKSKKKEDIYRNSNLYKIGNILYLMIPIIILFTTIEIIHLMNLKNGDHKNDYSLICFNEFYKLYFQLFSSILSIVCIKYNSGCVNIMSLYSNITDDLNEDFKDFNFSQFFYGQSQVLLKTFLERKSNLTNIHQNIGKVKYKEIFEQEVTYIRISKNFTGDKTDLSLMKVNMIFSEAILISMNSFQVLTNNTLYEPIYFLNKREEPFLYFDNYGNNTKNLSDFQKELYEMILNYKIYWTQFRFIYFKLLEALSIQTKNIRFYIYFYFNISYAIIFIMLIMLHIYLYYFDQLIVKILNYVNMIINTKDDNFDFFQEFSKKIQNLNIILKIYEENPIKAVQSLISGYNKYEKYIINKKRNMNFDFGKKTHKKSIENKNVNDVFSDVPKHLRIIKKNDIGKLYIMFHYYLMSIIIFIIIVLTYILLFLLWRKYYLIKDNLYSLLKKDTQLEISFFKAINMYNLMIFDNYTLDDLAKDIFYEPDSKFNDGIHLLNSFYDDLFLAFNFEIEIKILVSTFSGFPFFNFTCENLYIMQSDSIKELEANPEIQKIGNAGRKMFEICSRSGIDFYNDITTAFGNHYQSVLQAITLVNKFSYEGLVNHLKEGYFGRIYLTFNFILMYITDIINVKLHKVEYDNLLDVLSQYLMITIFLIIILYIILIFIVIFFYISRLKEFCNQIILLKQVFQLCEVHEQ